MFLPDGNGVDLVSSVKKTAPNVEIILLTAHGNIPDGVQAIKNGAFDYITKGDDNNKIMSIDLGVNNLASIVTNVSNKSILIDGRRLKSIRRRLPNFMEKYRKYPKKKPLRFIPEVLMA